MQLMLDSGALPKRFTAERSLPLSQTGYCLVARDEHGEQVHIRLLAKSRFRTDDLLEGMARLLKVSAEKALVPYTDTFKCDNESGYSAGLVRPYFPTRLTDRHTCDPDQLHRTVSILLSGLESLRKSEMLHLGINPSNVVFDGEQMRTVDWGLLDTVFHPAQSSSKNIAPERSTSTCTGKTDVYDIGQNIIADWCRKEAQQSDGENDPLLLDIFRWIEEMCGAALPHMRPSRSDLQLVFAHRISDKDFPHACLALGAYQFLKYRAMHQNCRVLPLATMFDRLLGTAAKLKSSGTLTKARTRSALIAGIELERIEQMFYNGAHHESLHATGMGSLASNLESGRSIALDRGVFEELVDKSTEMLDPSERLRSRTPDELLEYGQRVISMLRDDIVATSVETVRDIDRSYSEAELLELLERDQQYLDEMVEGCLLTGFQHLGDTYYPRFQFEVFVDGDGLGRLVTSELVLEVNRVVAAVDTEFMMQFWLDRTVLPSRYPDPLELLDEARSGDTSAIKQLLGMASDANEVVHQP